MRFANIANYFSNSKELLNKFGEQIINAASEVKAPKKFINDVTFSFPWLPIKRSQDYTKHYSGIQSRNNLPKVLKLLGTL